jgi:hypothetical protein
MPIVSNPIISDLILEGIKQAGENSPSSALLNRASSQWVEQIKNDIWHLAKKPKILHVTAYTVINPKQSRYSYPTDFSSDLTLTLLAPKTGGNCNGGSINTVVLDPKDQVNKGCLGLGVLMTSGNSIGSYGQVVSYDSATNTASVVPDFHIAPTSGDSYMTIGVEYPVETRPVFDGEARTNFITPKLPQYLYPIGDDHEGYFFFDSPPDQLYGARLRYYADLSQVDTSSDLMSVIYRRWRNIFIEGIRAKKLQDEDDDRAQVAMQTYKQNLMNLIYREIYGMDLSNITDRIMDYY